MVDVPRGLAWLRTTESGSAWLDRLPRHVADLARTWDLEVGDPYPDSSVSWVAPALRHGEPVVLKVQWPHEECEHEADALRAWNGNGAVRLLEHDPGRHALLIERCAPGTHLANEPETNAMAVTAALLQKLWVPAGDEFRSLAEEAHQWSGSLLRAWESAGRPCELDLVHQARDLLDHLTSTQGEQVLVHQDLHGDNVLASERSPWLAIDPKPLVGEREFSCAPIIRSFEYGHSPQQVMARLDELSATLELDRERCRGWAIAQTMAWSFTSDHMSQHHDTVRWLLAE